LVKVNGVKSVEVDFANRQAKVAYDPAQVTPEQLIDVLQRETTCRVGLSPP